MTSSPNLVCAALCTALLLSCATAHAQDQPAASPPKAGRAPEPKPETATLLLQSQKAFQAGKRSEALALANQAVKLEPDHPRPYFIRAKIHEMSGHPEQAVADYDKVAGLDKTAIDIYQSRGGEKFKMGRVEAALEDFDKYLSYRPDQAPHHWQRGIALYYLDRFEEGRKQFDSHQSVNPSDVENAAWHFLCNARAIKDPARAAREILKVGEDRRPMMMDIYELYKGAKTVEYILDEVAKLPSGPKKQQGEFYAALYIGLYYEALGEHEKARPHLIKSASLGAPFGYMGDVARVHVIRKYR